MPVNAALLTTLANPKVPLLTKSRRHATSSHRYERSQLPNKRCAAAVEEGQEAGASAWDQEPVVSTARADYNLFVRFLHLASPYVVGHRGKTFVIVIPGEVIVRRDRLYPLLEDILLLHGLGICIVLVCGAAPQINAYLEARGLPSRMVGAYRVTDEVALQGALEAAGTTCTEIAAQLSKAPSIPMVRRHSRSDGQQMHFAPPVQVINGNYVTAKRRGVVGGVDFQHMGQVRFVQAGAINQQLQAGAIVLLTNVGVSAAGELLNCNVYDVATHAAVELHADKLLCLTGEDVRSLNLPQYLPLHEAEAMIQAAACLGFALEQAPSITSSIDDGPGTYLNGSSSSSSSSSNGSSADSNGNSRGRLGEGQELSLDLDSWQMIGYPPAVLAAAVACKHGVNRGHLVDMDTDGALLLELYTRDGTDGIRAAEARDASEVLALVELLQQAHSLQLPFALSELAAHLDDFTVIEREGKILGCCCCTDHGLVRTGTARTASAGAASVEAAPAAAEGGTERGEERVAELSAFIVHPLYRRLGFGDSLLDYAEQSIRLRGFTRVVLVAGQGSYDWFVDREFRAAGDARASPLLPAGRREQLAGAVPRGGAAPLLFAKAILAADNAIPPAGKRIGF